MGAVCHPRCRDDHHRSGRSAAVARATRHRQQGSPISCTGCGHPVAGPPQDLHSIVQPRCGHENEISVVARCGPDRDPARSKWGDDRAEHARRLRIVRLVAVPQRHPRLAARRHSCIGPPHHRPAIGTEDCREDVAADHDRTDSRAAAEDEPALQDTYLLACRRHRTHSPTDRGSDSARGRTVLPREPGPVAFNGIYAEIAEQVSDEPPRRPRPRAKRLQVLGSSR